MTRQANILSFDKAKREVGASRPSVPMPESPVRKRSSGALARPASGSRKAACGSRPTASSSEVARTSSRTGGSASEERRVRRDGAAAYRGSSAATRMTGSNRSPRKSEQDEEEAIPEKRSRFKEFRRKRQKERAGKKFSRQCADAGSASEAAAGPRAAVYKGEMGSQHKRASRMQNASSSGASAKRSPSAAIGAWRRSPKFIAGMATIVCMVLTCWFLYTPTQQLYHSVREHDRLQAEYTAIEQRNDSLQSEVDALQTDAGIEDRAHQQFGWVPEGYQTANVRGLSLQDGDESRFKANIVPGSIEAPETWYSPLLDALFGAS